MPLAESLRSVLAALSSPPADDVREALAWVEKTLALPVYANPAPDSYGEGVRDTLRTVTKLMRAEVHPYGTATDTAHDRDGALICRKCGQGLTAIDVVDGEKPCPGAHGTVTDTERLEYTVAAESENGAITQLADYTTVVREHLESDLILFRQQETWWGGDPGRIFIAERPIPKWVRS